MVEFASPVTRTDAVDDPPSLKVVHVVPSVEYSMRKSLTAAPPFELGGLQDSHISPAPNESDHLVLAATSKGAPGVVAVANDSAVVSEIPA